MRRLRRLLAIGACLGMIFAAVPGAVADDGDDLYVPKPNHDAKVQIAELVSSGDKAAAAMVKEMISTPQAFWVEKTDPKATLREVRQVVKHAAAKDQIPVLVAYNIPFRDCAQFSAGGATTVDEYTAWIDGMAAGIGNKPAIVILEPDGLGIIPWYKQFRGTSDGAADYEWCQPEEADEFTAADDRFVMMNYAVDALKANPNAKVYLDGTHSAWLGSGDAAHRLIQAGVERADGLFLNASNYRLTEHQEKYGQWISDCVYLSQNSWWQPQWCASQYYPADPNDFSTWHLSDAAYDQAFSDTGLTRNPDEQAHFVIDTSRNGAGPWTPTVSYPDAQDWCNPPDRGLGMTPTLDTANPYIDAYLWIKIPGESDGECTRGLGPAGETIDPEWGIIDPAAGHWFPEQVLDLITNADPAMAGVWPYKG